MSGGKRYQGGGTISGGYLPPGLYTVPEIAGILNRDPNTVGSFSVSADGAALVWHRDIVGPRRSVLVGH